MKSTLVVVSAFLFFACQSVPQSTDQSTPAPAPAISQLTREQAADIIRQNFQVEAIEYELAQPMLIGGRAVYGDVRRARAGPFIKAGLVAIEKRGSNEYFAITQKGKALTRIKTKPGQDILLVTIARKTFREVKEISQQDKTAIVYYTWEYDITGPYDLAQAMIVRWKNETMSGEKQVRLILTDNGWRIE